MQATLKRLSLAGSGILLLACAHSGEPARLAASADQSYQAGRSHHVAERFGQALQFYQAALRTAPAHVNARNGLATLYADQGRYPEAIALWKSLTASLAATPENAFLFSNLGYAQLLHGQAGQARAALEQACLLDPLNHRAWGHLGTALARLGQHERAQAMFKQAATLRGHDFKADYALAPRAGVAAIDSAVQAPAPAGAHWARTEVRQTAGGMFVLRRIEAAPYSAPTHALAARQETALLEIRNGNGVTGLARSLALSMGEGSPRVVRLTNQKGFGVQRTRVEYQLEFKDAAQRLAGRFGAAQLVAVDRVGRADMRLVIGADLRHLLVAGGKQQPALASTLPPRPNPG